MVSPSLFTTHVSDAAAPKLVRTEQITANKTFFIFSILIYFANLMFFSKNTPDLKTCIESSNSVLIIKSLSW